MIGSGNRYCDDINRHTLADDENIEAKVINRYLKDLFIFIYLFK
jgi:hypothetical protein